MLLRHQTVAVELDQAGERRYNIYRITRNDDHFVGGEGPDVWRAHRKVGLGDPESVFIAYDVLAEQAH